MIETLPFLLKVSALPTEAIAPAIRLAAELSLTDVLTEDKAITAAHVRASVWDRIRPSLAEVFEFTAGRVKMRMYDDINGFDLLAMREAAKEARKRPTKESNDPRVHQLIDLGMDEQKAKAFVSFGVRTYGAGHFEAALEIAKAKTPSDPKAFMIKVIQNRIGAATSGNGLSGIEAKKVQRQIRVQNPEAAKSEFIGWEAPSFDTHGVASYKSKDRQQVWRNRVGTASHTPAAPGTRIPTPLEDPGVIIVETLR